MHRNVTPLLAAAAYVVLCAEALYRNEWDWMLGHPFLMLIGIHILLGAAVASWWALPLPLIPFVLAIPVSNWSCDSGYECIGEPFAMFVLVGSLFLGIPCVAIGIAIAGRLQSGEKNSSRLPSGS